MLWTGRRKWICNWSQPRVAKGAVGAIGLLPTLCIKPSAKKASSPPGCRDPCGNVVWKGSIFSGGEEISIIFMLCARSAHPLRQPAAFSVPGPSSTRAASGRRSALIAGNAIAPLSTRKAIQKWKQTLSGYTFREQPAVLACYSIT